MTTFQIIFHIGAIVVFVFGLYVCFKSFLDEETPGAYWIFGPLAPVIILLFAVVMIGILFLVPPLFDLIMIVVLGIFVLMEIGY